ncbi:hypothetical protein [Pseudomonas sp. 06C 126]|uniref:hypothetical protein n=1 Tax=Pseudomonas TaxID=286 RepID=UPI000AA2B571
MPIYIKKHEQVLICCRNTKISSEPICNCSGSSRNGWLGSGNDVIIGNHADNIIKGGAGADT